MSYDGYADLELYYGDEHTHAATAKEFSRIDGPGADQTEGCAHAHTAPTVAYRRARANGLDFVVLSHHNVEVGNGPTALWLAREGRDWWMAQSELWLSPFTPAHDHATRNVAGFPLGDGTYTDSELRYLSGIADQETIPGEFVAFFGIELTVQGPTAPSCAPGAPLCGGHKVALCPGLPDTACATPNGALPPDLCEDESDFYAWAARNGCAVSAAHPCGPASRTDLTPFDPVTAPGGFDDSIVSGYEVSTRCIEDPNGRGFTDALDRGYRVSPRYGSDTHNRPGPNWGDGSSVSPGNLLVDNCHILYESAGSQARMGCFATGLDREAILEAMNLHRCFWVGADRIEPEIRVSVAESPGHRARPMGWEREVGPGQLALEVRATNDPSAALEERFVAVELVHAGDVVATEPCQDGFVCDASFSVPASVPGYYYARVQGASELLLIAAPIWVSPEGTSRSPADDADGDGVPDAEDNCPCPANPLQRDVGGPRGPGPDGVGDACQCGDANGDGFVDARDVSAIQLCANGGACSPLCDADADGVCTPTDLTAVSAALSGGPLPGCTLP